MKIELEKIWAGRISEEYDECAVLAAEVGEQMLSRLDWVTLHPQVIITMGCAISECTRDLHRRYPKAHIATLDFSYDMLNNARKKSLGEFQWINSPMSSLPFQENSVDLITANLLLPWCDRADDLLQEWLRVLRPEGLLMLTSFGPDTLLELQHLPLQFPAFSDMHILGDALVQAGFSDPVLDVDYLHLTYQDQAKLFHELQVTGMLGKLEEEFVIKKNNENVFSLTHEIIFAHAWGNNRNAGEIRIPLSHIKRR